MTNEELMKKKVNEMDPDVFATAIMCEKFWEWAKNPGTEETEKRKKLISKKYQLPEDSPLMRIMIAFLAGADAGADIVGQILEA